MLPNAPSLNALRERMANDLQLRMQQAGIAVDATQPGNGYFELVNVLAGSAYSLWGAADHIANQQLIESMDDVTAQKVGAEYGITRQAATFATGSVSLVATANVAVEQSTLFQSETGQLYRLDAQQNISAGQSQTASLTAVDAGFAANLSAGQVLNLVSPIAGLQSETNVVVAIAGGSDIEPIERYKSRIIERKQAPPLGGARNDYIGWAKAAHPDVTRAWVFEHENGVGSVTVRVVTENLPEPIASAAVVTAVNNYIDDVRPAGLRSLSVEAPTAVPVNITFSLLEPNTVAVQEAIRAELQDLLFKEGGPDSTLLLSHIRESISRAAGEQNFAISLNADLSFAVDEYPVLGSIVFP